MKSGQQRVDTRSVCLGQTGNKTALLHLTFSNLMEPVPVQPQWDDVRQGAECLTPLMDSETAGCGSQCCRGRNVSGDKRAVVYGFSHTSFYEK